MSSDREPGRITRFVREIFSFRRKELSPEELQYQRDDQLIMQAYRVFNGEFLSDEPSMGEDPAYYDSFISTPAHVRDYFREEGKQYAYRHNRYMYTKEPYEGHSLLPVMWRRVGEYAGSVEARSAFAQMVMDIPEMRPGRFIEAVWGLALHEWQYTEELAEKVKDPRVPIVTQEEWEMIRLHLPNRNIRGRATAQDHSDVARAFGEVARLTGQEEGLLNFIQEKAYDDETAEIKRRFQEWLQVRGY